MPHEESDLAKDRSVAARFAPTHWSVVLAAARTASPAADAAMDSLCAAYWHPVYAYLRRKGFTQTEAEDMTQEFFTCRVINGRIFRGMDRESGKFRTWLLNSLQNFLHNQRDRQQAQKRGGGAPHLSIDFEEAEGHYDVELRDDLTPEKLYDIAWASALLQRVLRLLQNKYAAEGRETQFAGLKCFLPGAYSQQPYAEAALRLGKSENAVKVAVSRLRQEYGEILRAEVERTVSTSAEARDELRYLMTVVSG